MAVKIKCDKSVENKFLETLNNRKYYEVAITLTNGKTYHFGAKNQEEKYVISSPNHIYSRGYGDVLLEIFADFIIIHFGDGEFYKFNLNHVIMWDCSCLLNSEEIMEE